MLKLFLPLLLKPLRLRLLRAIIFSEVSKLKLNISNIEFSDRGKHIRRLLPDG
jgi:hypothetical protein